MVWKKAKDIVTDLAESLPKDAADKSIDALKELIPKELPKVPLPKVPLPKVPLPKVQLPDVSELPSEFPKLPEKLANLSMPEMPLSGLTLPKVPLHKITLPPKPDLADLLDQATGLLPAKMPDVLPTELPDVDSIVGVGADLSEKVLQKWQALPSISAGAIAATLTGDDFRAMMTETFKTWAENTLGKVPDAYDKALDAAYNAEHIGGKFHRLFDGSHDPMGAWQKISDAGLGDTMSERVVGYTQALTKDFVTTMGLPFATIDKASFEHMVDVWSAIPGVDREYLYRFFTMNAADVVGTTLSSVGMILAIRGDNFQRLSEIVGSLGVSAIAHANPMLALVTIASAGYAFKIDQLSYGTMGVGASSAVIHILLCSVLSLPILVELIVAASIVGVVKANILENEELREYVVDQMVSTGGRILPTLG